MFLAPEMFITKETKDTRCAVVMTNSYAAGTVLINTKILRFYLKQGWKWGYLVFHKKRLEPTLLP